MNLAEAKALLPEMRQVLANVSPEWLTAYDIKSGRSQVCERDSADGLVYPLATFEKSIPTDARELILKAPVYLNAMLMLFEGMVVKYREVAPKPQPEKQQAKTNAQKCAIKCHRDGAFRVWLMERKDLHDGSDAERIKTHVRFLLSIDSLSKIDTDPAALREWRKMLAEFHAWKKAP